MSLVQITRQPPFISPITAPTNAIREEYAAKCLSCGACCSYYAQERRLIVADGIAEEFKHLTRVVVEDVEFEWGGNEKDTYHSETLAMQVTDTSCVALQGEVGRDVRCGIYEGRPGACRVFDPGSDFCLRIRKLFNVEQ